MSGNEFSETGYQSIDKVDITDDFMFAYVMRNPDICLELLRYLLPGRSIARVEYVRLESDVLGESQKPEIQKSMLGELGKRGVRLDAYLDDGKTVYNVEMQTTQDVALAKRTRLYTAHIDMNQLSRGEHYDMLRPSFVIFICKFDPFGMDMYRYAFENVCTNVDGLKLNDGSYKLFFNTSGRKGNINARLRELLEYMNNTDAFPVKQTDNALIETIDQAVKVAKNDEEWRRAYMIFTANMRDAEVRGEKRGIELGEKRGIELGEKRADARWEKRMNGTAKRLLARGMPVGEVQIATDLPLEVILEIQKEAEIKR